MQREPPEQAEVGDGDPRAREPDAVAGDAGEAAGEVLGVIPSRAAMRRLSQGRSKVVSRPEACRSSHSASRSAPVRSFWCMSAVM